MVFANAASSIATAYGIKKGHLFISSLQLLVNHFYHKYAWNAARCVERKGKEKQNHFQLFKPDTDTSSAKPFSEISDTSGVYCMLNALSNELPVTIALLCLCQNFRAAFLMFSGYDDQLCYLCVTRKIRGCHFPCC